MNQPTPTLELLNERVTVLSSRQDKQEQTFQQMVNVLSEKLDQVKNMLLVGAATFALGCLGVIVAVLFERHK